MLTLEIFTVIPFNYRILEFANPISITEDLENTIFYSSLFSIVGIREHSIFSGQRELWWKPLNGIKINHALHIE